MSSRAGLTTSGCYTNEQEASCMKCGKIIPLKKGTSIHTIKRDEYGSEWLGATRGFVCSEACRESICYNPWNYIPYES